MTGRSKAFEVGVYLALALVLLVGGGLAQQAGWAGGVLALLLAAVLFVFALRAAWSSRAREDSRR